MWTMLRNKNIYIPWRKTIIWIFTISPPQIRTPAHISSSKQKSRKYKIFFFSISSNFFVSQYFVVIISHNTFVSDHDRNTMHLFDFVGIFLYVFCILCEIRRVESKILGTGSAVAQMQKCGPPKNAQMVNFASFRDIFPKPSQIINHLARNNCNTLRSNTIMGNKDNLYFFDLTAPLIRTPPRTHTHPEFKSRKSKISFFFISSNFFLSQYFVVIISHNTFVFIHDQNAMHIFDFGAMFRCLLCMVGKTH